MCLALPLLRFMHVSPWRPPALLQRVACSVNCSCSPIPERLSFRLREREISSILHASVSTPKKEEISKENGAGKRRRTSSHTAQFPAVWPRSGSLELLKRAASRHRRLNQRLEARGPVMLISRRVAISSYSSLPTTPTFEPQ